MLILECGRAVQEPIVITGMGVVSHGGLGVDNFRRSIYALEEGPIASTIMVPNIPPDHFLPLTSKDVGWLFEQSIICKERLYKANSLVSH